MQTERALDTEPNEGTAIEIAAPEEEKDVEIEVDHTVLNTAPGGIDIENAIDKENAADMEFDIENAGDKDFQRNIK